MNSLFVAKDNLQKSALLIVFKINCSPLGLLSDFLGHKDRVQCGLIGREIAIVLKFQSGATLREQRRKFEYFRGNYASVNIH